MYSIPEGRSAELTLMSHEANDVVNVLEFRLRCKREQKMGMIAKGFGRSVWVDRDGSYMDGYVDENMSRIANLLAELA